jgi:2-methylcitrate dehydratase PrpD
MKTLSEAYANYAVGLRFEDLPEEVVERVKYILLDFIGVSVAGCECPGSLKLKEVLLSEGNGKATVLGCYKKTNLLNAALINGTISHYLDMDDGHKGSISHPAVAILPAMFALAETIHCTGREFITATVAAYEIMCRIGTVMQPEHQSKRGFHTTGTCGTIGAAIGCSKLLKLNEEQMQNAIGLACIQASGLLEVMNSGVMSKPFIAGKAAYNGLLSALLAAKGMQSPKKSLEGQKGFFNAMCGKWDEDKALRGLGEEYLVLDVYFKFHAACGLIHSSADALLDLQRKHFFKPEDVEYVEIGVQTYAYEVVGKSENLKEGAEMKFSIPFSAAIVLIYGDLLPNRFNDENLNNSKIRSLVRKIIVYPSKEMDTTFPKLRSSTVTVKLRSGEVLNMRVDAAKGHPENSPTKAELEKKFFLLSKEYMPSETANRVKDRILMFEQEQNVEDLVRLAYKGNSGKCSV